MKFLVSLCFSSLITLLSFHFVQVVISMVLVPALSDAEADPAILAQPQLPAFIDPASGRFSFSFNTEHPAPGEDGKAMEEAEADRASVFNPYATRILNPYSAVCRSLPGLCRGIPAPAGPAHAWGYPGYPQYNPWTAGPVGYPGARGAFYPPGLLGGYQPALHGYYPGYPYYALPQPAQGPMDQQD